MDTSPILESAFSFGFGDDQDALCADSSSVNRVGDAFSSRLLAAREPHIRLEAAVRDDLAGDWICSLARAANGKRPMKWADVAGLVRHGYGVEGQQVRSALERQVVVVTDPMALAREVDLGIVDDGRTVPLFGGVLVNAIRPTTPPLISVQKQVREWVARDLLLSTGVGTVESLLLQSERSIMHEAPDHGVRTRRFADDVRGSLRRATKLASRSMMLVLHERDPEARSPSPLRNRWSGIMRFGDPHAMITHARLQEIAKARIIFDKGEEDVTRAVDALRAQAELVVAYSPLEDPAMRGYARDGDDANYLRLQIADITVGYARAIMEDPRHARCVLAELQRRFRLVLYNGRRLSAEEAQRFDADRIRHRAIVQRTFGAAA